MVAVVVMCLCHQMIVGLAVIALTIDAALLLADAPSNVRPEWMDWPTMYERSKR